MKQDIKPIIFFLTTICTIVSIMVGLGVIFGAIDYKFNSEVFMETTSYNSNLYMNKELADELNTYYADSKREFSACIIISQEKTQVSNDNLNIDYYLTGIEGQVKYSGFDHSTNEMCNYGTIHSHPKGTPYFSIADITAFKSRIKEGETFAVIIHGENEFTYITRNDFEEKKVVITN
ncbi:hypothetical protein C0585_08135 [Candidatus Woesearchaeota archaeon]|nr:MAG: hypothetical protein C0585_08135 [Candidatus Woesearchaeota archaeon]